MELRSFENYHIPIEINKINSEHGVQIQFDGVHGTNLQAVGNTLQIEVYNERLSRWFYKKYKIPDNRINYTLKYIGNSTFLVPDNLYTALIHLLWFCGVQDGRGNCLYTNIVCGPSKMIKVEQDMLKTIIPDQIVVNNNLVTLETYNDTVNWPILHIRQCIINSTMIVTN
jgi:hypothetical protein